LIPKKRQLRVRFVVEGDAEESAMPRLLERWQKRRKRYGAIECAGVINTHGVAKLLNPHDPARRLGIEYYVGQATRDLGYPGAVIVVLDADDRCPKVVDPALLARARAASGGFHVAVVIANREFENWLLAELPAILTGESRAASIEPAPLPGKDVESHRAAHAYLWRRLGRYEKARDAGRLVGHMNFDDTALERSRSLRKLDKELLEVTRLAQEASYG
jgi:hypothetical protein